MNTFGYNISPPSSEIASLNFFNNEQKKTKHKIYGVSLVSRLIVSAFTLLFLFSFRSVQPLVKCRGTIKFFWNYFPFSLKQSFSPNNQLFLRNHSTTHYLIKHRERENSISSLVQNKKFNCEKTLNFRYCTIWHSESNYWPLSVGIPLVKGIIQPPCVALISLKWISSIQSLTRRDKIRKGT